MRKSQVLKVLSAVTCLLLAAGTMVSAAQEMPRLGHPPQNPDQGDDSTETLKVNVNVVQLFFNVKDKKGGLIPNLTKDDFEIVEDGKPQTVKYFTAE